MKKLNRSLILIHVMMIIRTTGIRLMLVDGFYKSWEGIMCSKCWWVRCDWGWLWCWTSCDFVNASLYDFIKKKEKDVKDCAKEDVMEVVMETKFMLSTFDSFYDPNVILYFTSKLILLLWKGFRDLFIMPNMYMWFQEVSMMVFRL